MNELILGPAIAAVIAALGYVGKLIVESWRDGLREERERRAKLASLYSLLMASKSVFETQNKLCRVLARQIAAQDSATASLTYDEILSRVYSSGDAVQKALHGLVREYTTGALKPLNKSMLDWLNRDTYYKLDSSGAALAAKLRVLEAHLVLWLAKYDFWIPSHPEHALVYMADENEHGVGFPIGIEDLVQAEVAGDTLAM
jgi:hypothetical protein